MNDPLGEALADIEDMVWPSEVRYNSAVRVMAAARNWHALTQGMRVTVPDASGRPKDISPWFGQRTTDQPDPPPVDIQALRAALDAWPNELGDDDEAEELATFLAFRAAQILLESPSFWYCTAHDQTNWNDQGCWVYGMGPGSCDMRPARLVLVDALTVTAEDE